jgi:hypothetical protein
MKVTHVKAVESYKIVVTFDDGTSGIVDLGDLVQKGIFRDLKDPLFFAKVYTTGEAIAWNDDLEIDTLNIYAKIVKKDPSELARKYFTYAAD